MKGFSFRKIKEDLQCFNRPIYETVITSVVSMIESGEFPPGSKFPPDKQLAGELGISHVTLAKALNELRRRNILERRRATGTFVPEVRNSELSLKSRKKIAVVVDYASEKTFQQQLFLQLHHGLEELNCTMLFFSSDNDPEKQLQQLTELINDFSISGCIVWSILSPVQAKEILLLRPRYYPLIFLDKHYPGLEHDAVTYNNFECGAAVSRALQRKGVREIYWFEEDQQQQVCSLAERREGVRQVLKPGIRFIETDLAQGIHSLPDHFTADSAIICSDFVTALKLKEIAVRGNIILPRHLLTFETVIDDHSLISEFTAYRFPCELGKEALKILASRMNGKEACTFNHSGKWNVLGATSAAGLRDQAQMKD